MDQAQADRIEALLQEILQGIGLLLLCEVDPDEDPDDLSTVEAQGSA